MKRSKLDRLLVENNKKVADFLKSARIMFSTMDLESIVEELNQFVGEIYPFWSDRPKYKIIENIENIVKIDDGGYDEGYYIFIIKKNIVSWALEELKNSVLPSSW